MRQRFHQRIEKACTTMSEDHLNKEIGLCRKEIERLEKENLKKDRAIFDMKASSSHIRELEVPLSSPRPNSSRSTASSTSTRARSASTRRN